MSVTDWYQEDDLARRLCNLDEAEARKFAGSELLDVRPVALPRSDAVLTHNDYWDWPIATTADGAIVVLFDMRPAHFGTEERPDAHTGIRYIVTSADGGSSWSSPVDLHGVGTWQIASPFAGWNAGLGSHDGSVYAILGSGLYSSEDRGATWSLVDERPDFSRLSGHPDFADPETKNRPGMRITFDDEHGLIVWSCNMHYRSEYGNTLRAVYSPDYGHTWHVEEQPLPAAHEYSEMTPLVHDGRVCFFNRSPRNQDGGYYAQGFSCSSGWFPFNFVHSDVYHASPADTPDIIFNPQTKRFEVVAPHRHGNGPGPAGQAKCNLYSMSPEDFYSSRQHWRYEGTLVRYRDDWGLATHCDGFNPVGSVALNGRQYVYVWGGDIDGKAGIFQYSRSLDTDAVSDLLLRFYEGTE